MKLNFLKLLFRRNLKHLKQIILLWDISFWSNLIIIFIGNKLTWSSVYINILYSLLFSTIFYLLTLGRKYCKSLIANLNKPVSNKDNIEKMNKIVEDAIKKEVEK